MTADRRHATNRTRIVARSSLRRRRLAKTSKTAETGQIPASPFGSPGFAWLPGYGPVASHRVIATFVLADRVQSPSEIFFQDVRGGLCAALEIERGNEAALFVHEINNGHVIHGVAAVFERDLLGVDPIRFLHCGDFF